MKPTVAPAPHLRGAGLVIAIVSLIAIAFATLMPEAPAAVGSIFCLLCGPLGGVSAIQNVALFAPLGAGLALAGLSGKRALPAMCVLSVLIETAQFFVIPGRYATIGDVLTNTLGGALGFAIGRYAYTLLRPSPRIASALTLAWFAVWLASQTITAFGFSPALPMSDYYGQLAPSLGNFEQFRGRVLRASIGGVVVPDTRFTDSQRVRALLLGGAFVTMTVVPASPTRDLAPIVRVADGSQREIVLLGQNAENLTLGIRTGAAVLRLRPAFFAVADIFPAVSHGGSGLINDALSVRARYSAREVLVNTQSVRTSRARRIPITASLGWTMLLPFQWYIEGTRTEFVVSTVWMACLLLPIGYWGAAILRLARRRDATTVRIATMSIAFVFLYAGLVLTPRSFGVSVAGLSDWVAALTGILLGAALAAAIRTGRARCAPADCRPAYEN
jgi:hypothetical protein